MRKKQVNSLLVLLIFAVFGMFAFLPFLQNNAGKNLAILPPLPFDRQTQNQLSLEAKLSTNTTYGIMQSGLGQQMVASLGKQSSSLFALNQEPPQENKQQTEIEKSLLEQAKEQLDNLNFEEVESLLENLEDKTKNLFVQVSFKDKIKSILAGDFKLLGDNALQAAGNLVFTSIADLVPLMASIVAIGIMSGMLNQIRSDKSGKGLGDIIHFVCYGLILILITTSVYKLLKITSAALGNIKGLVDGVFPILLTLLTAVGGTVSVGVYQPAIALFSGSIVQVFNSILVPIFIFSFAFSVISNFSSGVKLNKFSSFLNSLFKWIIGTVFTVFIAFITIQGLTASSFDGVSVKTAKFAVKNTVPFLGSYLADGFNLIIASSVLIKNAVGLSGLVILILNVMAPIISIGVFSLFCKLVASILEPVTDGRVSSFLFGVSKSISMLSAILIGVSFMFLILTGLVMFTANFV